MSKTIKKKRKKSYRKRLKNWIENVKAQKYKIYLGKLLGICFIFVIVTFILILHHSLLITQENFSEKIIELLYLLILDIAIILIPLVLLVSNIKKNFHEERNELKDLRSSLINIRYESSYKLIGKLGDEKDKKELLNNVILKKFKDPFFLSPLIVDNAILKLRKFNLRPGTETPYADVFGFMIRCEEFLELEALDDLIYKIFKLLKNYGEKDGFRRIEKGNGSFNDDLLKKIKDNLKEKDYDYIRKMLFTDLDWVLIYKHHIKAPEPHTLTLYRKKY